ncbi:MAG: iron-sulfur cluster biosynthesis family protein [Bacillota bacterium]|nr:iron-sulfur cluster biosynthesis family protein [Bacillota bacterium]
MEILITEAAAEKINEKIQTLNGYIKLKYDIEGCGCAVDGVSALWLVPELDGDDIAIETNDRPIYMEKSKTVFFDEQMKIDFSNTSNSFQLKSPNQILNGRLNFIIQTK